MFLVFLFSCDVEIPDLMFENNGPGQIWIGGNSLDDLNSENLEQDEVEQDESVDTATEQENDTGDDTGENPYNNE